MSPELHLLVALAAFSASTAAASSNPTSLTDSFPKATVQAVDVAIIGGGSSGSNAAIHLSDAGLSIGLIEKEDRLGGHVNSWTDPTTGTNYEYGVAVYTNYTGTTEYFARLGIPTKTPSFSSDMQYYADFTTGQTVDYIPPNATDQFTALARYYNISSQYAPLFAPSYANWPEDPTNIPEDLLLPFRDFALKYDIGPAMLLLWTQITAGMADMLDVPTLFVFQAFGPETAASFLGITGSLIPASGRNQDIYDTIKDILGDSVMLSSHVVKSARYPDDAGAELLVKHANGSFTIVQAERLVIAIQPTLSNLEAFDVDETESAVFSQPTWSDVHTGIVSNPALPDDGFINNLPADAAGGNNYALPAPPYMDYFGYMGPDLWQAIAVDFAPYSTSAAQSLTAESLQNLAAAGTIPPLNDTSLDTLAWSNHGPMHMRTSAEAVRAGFITQMNALQGYRSTFWTGGFWTNQLSTHIWAYNAEYLVPKVLESL